MCVLGSIAATQAVHNSNYFATRLKSNFDESFKLFMDMVRHPAFQPDRFEVYKSEQIERMKQRNDDAGPILSREWNALLFGREHFFEDRCAAPDLFGKRDEVVVEALLLRNQSKRHDIPRAES